MRDSYPPGPGLIPMVEAMFKAQHDALGTLTGLTRTYGDLMHIGTGPYHLYVVNHPDFVYEVLVRQADKFHKPRRLARPIASFLGNGLLISEDEFWKRQRRLMQPAFHHRRIDTYGQVMVGCITEMLNRWQRGQVYDIEAEMMKLTLPIVTQNLFGADVLDTARHVAHAVEVIQKVSYQQGQAKIAAIPEWLPLPAYNEKRQATQLLNQIVYRIIREARLKVEDKGDLLSLLLAARDDQGQQMSEEQVRDEVMTLLLAGHESTANAITWMWYLLAQHPAVESKLHDELDTVLDGRPPAVVDLQQLPYTQMVVKEALRLYPPAWALPREPVEDVMLGGFKIRKGSLVAAIVYLIQRDGRFFDAPDEFKPERFANDGEKRFPRMAYIPFGSGPRLCIGNAFALMAMQLTLATIGQRLRLSLAPDQEVALDPLLTLRPRYGMRMKITEREPALTSVSV